MATYFDLSLIIFQEKDLFMEAAAEYPAIANIKIYSTKNDSRSKDIFSLLPAKFENAFRYRWIKKQLQGPADSMFLEYYPILKRLLKSFKYDCIVLENLATLNAISIIRKYDFEVKIIYDAHNVDTNLAANAVAKFGMNKAAQSKIHSAESSLHTKVNAIITCSDLDTKDFLEMNQNKIVAASIPNGVSTGNVCNEGVFLDEPEYILFCGALWSPPNSEGLLWFYNSIWPGVKKAFPALKLLVVGSGEPPASLLQLLSDVSLEFTGAVADVKPFYNQATVAIVPLLSGSGTRLKVLEAMSYGLPVISTSKGAEGIDYKTGENILIEDHENEFAEKVIYLLCNRNDRISIGHKGSKMAIEKYDWNTVGKKLESFINNQ